MMQCTLYLVAAILVMSGGLTTAQTDCFEEDIAYPKSKKIKSTGAASPEDCQADCKVTAGCVWWTWRPESLTSTGKAACNLKAIKNEKKMVTKTGAVSGPKECPVCEFTKFRDDTIFALPQGDMESLGQVSGSSDASHVLDCIDEAQLIAGCNVIQFSTGGGIHPVKGCTCFKVGDVNNFATSPPWFDDPTEYSVAWRGC